MFDNDIEVVKASQKFRFEHAMRVWHDSFPIQLWSRDQIRSFIDKIRRTLSVTAERRRVLSSVPVTVDCVAYAVDC